MLPSERIVQVACEGWMWIFYLSQYFISNHQQSINLFIILLSFSVLSSKYYFVSLVLFFQVRIPYCKRCHYVHVCVCFLLAILPPDSRFLSKFVCTPWRCIGKTRVLLTDEWGDNVATEVRQLCLGFGTAAYLCRSEVLPRSGKCINYYDPTLN